MFQTAGTYSSYDVRPYSSLANFTDTPFTKDPYVTTTSENAKSNSQIRTRQQVSVRDCNSTEPTSRPQSQLLKKKISIQLKQLIKRYKIGEDNQRFLPKDNQVINTELKEITKKITGLEKSNEIGQCQLSRAIE